MNKHVFQKSVIDADDLWFGEITPEIMEIVGRMKLERFLVLVKQVSLRFRSAGGIIMPDQVKDDQVWTHGLVQVVKLGPGCYQGRRFADLGLGPDDAPEPGQLITINAKVPERIKIKGVLFFTVPDDAFKIRVARQDIQDISFTIE